MFKGEKYITSGILQKIPLRLVSILYDKIYLLNKKINLDYLQVFDVKTDFINDEYFYIISHKQENPNYKIKYKILKKLNEPIIDEKIYIINSDVEQYSYSTVLLAEEY